MSPKRHQVLSTYIARRRQRSGLSQQQLADQLGVTKATVSYWESGTTAPQSSLLEPLARALSVSFEELATRGDYAIPTLVPEPPTYLRKLFPDISKKSLTEANRLFERLDREQSKRGGKRV